MSPILLGLSVTCCRVRHRCLGPDVAQQGVEHPSVDAKCEAGSERDETCRCRFEPAGFEVERP